MSDIRGAPPTARRIEEYRDQAERYRAIAAGISLPDVSGRYIAWARGLEARADKMEADLFAEIEASRP